MSEGVNQFNKFNLANISSNFSKLSNLRIIQNRLVYVIGLSMDMINKENALAGYEYFGQYGRIVKLVVNRNKVYNTNGPNGPSYSAYVTYSACEEASIAILALDNWQIESHTIRASYGTTKYCSNFLKGFDCFNKDCLYLHAIADPNYILEREDMSNNKSIFIHQQIIAMKSADIFNPEKKKTIKSRKFATKSTVFPCVSSIYDKSIVKENYKKLNKNVKNVATIVDENYDMSQSVVLFKKRNKSRFEFANKKTSHNCTSVLDSDSSFSSFSTLDNSIEIPNFVSDLISKKASRHSFFKNILRDDFDLTYFDRTLIRQYTDNNPWALFIINNVKNIDYYKNEITNSIETEKLNFVKNFNSA